MASACSLRALLWASLGMRVLAYASVVLNLTFLCHDMDGVPGRATSLGSAISVAIDRVHGNESLLSDVVLNYTWQDTACNVGVALDKLVESAQNENFSAIFGTACSEVVDPVAQLAGVWNIPMMGFMTLSLGMSNKNIYPTYGRSICPVKKIALAIVEICQHFGWQHVGLIGSDAEVPWAPVDRAIEHIFSEANLSLAESVLFDTDRTELYSKNMRTISSIARIIIVAADKNVSRGLLLAAYDQGLTRGDYVFIQVDLYPEEDFAESFWSRDDGRDDDAIRAFESALLISPKSFISPEYDQFLDDVRTKMAEPPFLTDLSNFSEVDGIRAAYLHDAVLGYAYAVNRMMAKGYNATDGRMFVRELQYTQYHGLTGHVTFDSNGDRRQDYGLYDFNDGEFQEVGLYDAHNVIFFIFPGKEVVWPDGSSTPPADRPECDFDGSLCNYQEEVLRKTGIAIGALLFCILLASPFLISYYLKVKRRQQFERELMSFDWKINFPDIHINRKSRSVQSVFSTASENSTTSYGTTITSSTSFSGKLMQIFTTRGTYKGQVVALKMVAKKSIVLDREQLLELRMMKESQNEHLCRFIGVCIEPPNVCIVTQYCAKGSLQDILENDDIKLDRVFRMSFASDIVTGLHFIHNKCSIGSHGNLKSSDCLVDNRWVVKLTDFGLWKFKAGQEVNPNEESEHAYYKKLFWRAPELLRHPDPPPMGTKKGDIYSLGIILQEIILRDQPYCMYPDMAPKEIIKKVQQVRKRPFRPKVTRDLSSGNPHLLYIMERCFSENPQHRPDTSMLNKMIRSANYGKQASIMDNMVSMLETYANNLEDLVAQRTMQLSEEKKKTDELLHRMVPPSVADHLKSGKSVEPEAFDDVTIFFSDIVGFTSLSAESTPLQVVALLNDLYVLFDGIISNYDVYKVETIGDAYMVVSGLPIRNDNRHAGEISTMSLDLLSAVGKFTIRHMPDRILQLRIGVHSGPCVAGVVGLTMPRYCLFGDTVNTASRYESTGEALRIHVSGSTMDKLKVLGGYHYIERGVVEMKGKGAQTTYWLTGKDGFNKPIPSLVSEITAS